jgi:plastocyanin
MIQELTLIIIHCQHAKDFLVLLLNFSSLSQGYSSGNPDYDPDTLTLMAGSDVTVVNQDTVPHTVTYGTGIQDTNSAIYFDTSIVNPGESITMSLAAELNPGQYDYCCIIHRYMKGAIIVERE